MGKDWAWNAPREGDGVAFCDVLVTAEVLVHMAAWVIIIWNKGECPS